MIGSESGPGGRFFDELMYQIATAAIRNTISDIANSLLHKPSINILKIVAIALSMISLTQMRAAGITSEGYSGSVNTINTNTSSQTLP